jgi:hypothetical protein
LGSRAVLQSPLPGFDARRAANAPRRVMESHPMGYIEKQRGKYRARCRDPLGRVTSTTFAGKTDAQRFLVEMEVDKSRGAWIDPRNADLPLGHWAEEFRFSLSCLTRIRTRYLHLDGCDQRLDTRPYGKRGSDERCFCPWWCADAGGALWRFVVPSAHR